MSRIVAFLLLCITGTMAGQPVDFVRIQQTGAENYQLVSENYYDGKSLWGYMNGGADLYLEYGFEGLLVQEITYNGISIKCEIFRMKGPEPAFGIYSVQKQNCRYSSHIQASHCINNYQVQLRKGNYYISFINQTGQGDAQSATMETAAWFDKAISSDTPVTCGEPFFDRQMQTAVHLRGVIALGNVYPGMLSLLEQTPGFTMWLIPAGKKAPAVSLIQFQSNEHLLKYAALAFPGKSIENGVKGKTKNGSLLTARKINDVTLIQIDGKADPETKKMLGFE